MSDHERSHHAEDEQLAQAVLRLAHELAVFNNEWRKSHKSHSGFVTKEDLDNMEKRIMASQAELTADLKAVLAQQQKTSTEIATLQASVDAQTVRIAELEAFVVAGGTIGQELVDAVAAVKAQAQVIDDQIPDVAPPTPPVV